MTLRDELRALVERSNKLSETEHLTNIHRILSIEVATGFTKQLGYDFEPARIQRIADEARLCMKETGAPAWYAYWHGINIELAVYGDPNYKGPAPVGILKH